jgi:hypothetical protein
MKASYPKIYQYLKRFEKVLRERKSRGVSDMVEKRAPFYTMSAVGDYTFAPYKVVWQSFGVSRMIVAVCTESEGKPVMTNQAMHIFIPLPSRLEADYICASMNSVVFEFAVISHTQKGGKSFAQSNILRTIRIPKFDPAEKVHQELASLSHNAHHAVSIGDETGVLEKLEQRIDELAAQIWRLTAEELREIRDSLKELKS